MSNIQFRNVIFSAVLMSSAVFSALTLPLVLFEPESHSSPPHDLALTDTPSLLAQGFQPILDIFESGNKGLAIRYIGFSIVASVGAGIATAELIRKASRRPSLLNDPQFGLSLDDSFTLPLSDSLPHSPSSDWTEEWVAVNFQELMQEQQPTQTLISIGATASSSNPEYSDSTYSRATFELEVANVNVLIDTESNPSNVISLVGERAIAVDSTAVTIVDDPTSYQTCRINVPHLEKRLFAVLYQGRYYRLVRARKNRDKALELAARFRQLNHEVLITQNDTTYTVWILEPQAFPSAAYPG